MSHVPQPLPCRLMPWLIVVFAAGGLLIPGAAPAQGPEPESEARSAAYRYESLLRRRAPERFGGSGGGPCDEVIGRFCFTFDDEDAEEPAPEPEHPDVVAARRLAILAYRRWMSVEPASEKAAGGLIRYLIEDSRPDEAVSVALAHTWAAPGPEALLVLGLARHYSGDYVAAEAAFDSARALLSPEERDRMDDIGVLLEPRERSVFGRLEGDARLAYIRRFWALSDPSLRIPGNERRAAHYARHAWIQILEEAPRAAGMTSWGKDREEIILRFGVPQRRERVPEPAWRFDRDLNIVSIYDPAARSFVPTALISRGVPPLAGLDEETSEPRVPRSLYAPVTLPDTRSLDDAQVTRLPAPGGWILRIDALLPPDTAAAPPVDPQGLLVIMDTLGRELGRVQGHVERHRDSVVVRAEAEATSGTFVFQAEIADDSTGRAAVARHSIRFPGGELVLSDPLIAAVPPGGVGRSGPDRAGLQPSPSLVLAPGQTVLVYGEVQGLTRLNGDARYAVEWWLEPLGGSLVGRALRWIGGRLGLTSPSPPVRVRWEASSGDPGPVVLAFALDLSRARTGLQRLGLRVVDRISGREVSSSRVFRLEPGAVALPVPGPG